jgi:predicted RNA-binding Zn-ribbon protein involved in translation (DUF1610 family)
MAKTKIEHKADVPEQESVSDILIPDSQTLEFVCPNCGALSQNDVIFLCNTCENSDLIFKDGVYMCPQCLYPGDNFECMKCESKTVRMRRKEPAKNG